MDSLAKEDNIRDLEESLHRLPGDLDKTYDDALDRIKSQDLRKRARADQVLKLIICAQRPLSLAEMREALSIRNCDTSLDPRALPKMEALISSCCGLVVVEDESWIVRLVHYTTEEYFRRKLPHYRSPEAHRYFAGILVTYLSFSTFATFSQNKMDQYLRQQTAEGGRLYRYTGRFWGNGYEVESYLKDLFESTALLNYAAKYWGHHARHALTNRYCHRYIGLSRADTETKITDNSWNLEQMIPDLLDKKANIACANEFFYSTKTKLGFWHYRSPTDITNLHIVASFGIRYFVECFLVQEIDISLRDSAGRTALHNAARNGHVDVVRLLLDAGASIDTLDLDRRSALVWAVRKNQISVTKLLLKRGSGLQLRDPDARRHSLMSIAAAAGHEKMVELLAAHFTDDPTLNRLMGNALVIAALSERSGIVRLLMRERVCWTISNQYSMKAMIEAASEGHVSIMRILLEAGVNVSSLPSFSIHLFAGAAPHDLPGGSQWPSKTGAVSSLEDHNSDLPLHAAARGGHIHAIALLLEAGADVDAHNFEGETALIVLAKSIGPFSGNFSISKLDKYVSTMKLLLKRGASTAATDRSFNRTPLEWSVLHGHRGRVQLLLQFLQQGCLSATRKNVIIYLTKLYYAVWTDDEESVRTLLRVEIIHEIYRIPGLLLLCIPALRGYNNVVLKFLQSGAVVETRTPLGESALHSTAEFGHIRTIELLLHRGADINSETSLRCTPLLYAIRGERADVTKFLLDHGAYIDGHLADSIYTTTAITQSLYGSTSTITKMLLERGADVNLRDVEAHGGTLLHVVSRNQSGGSQTEKIKLLLEHGADLEADDEDGKTPLAAAAEDYTHEALPILLERGAQLEARDYKGRTPLGAAVCNNNTLGVQILLEKGANLETRDDRGHSPLVLAVRQGHLEMVRYLLSAGADPQALPSAITAENEDVYDYDFERALKIVLEAQSRKL